MFVYFQSDRDSSKPPPSEVLFATKPKLQQLSRKEVIINVPRHEKTGILPMQKQRRRSASQ